MMKHDKKKSSRAGPLGQVLGKKASESNPLQKKPTNMSFNSVASSKKSQRISRYSNVNISMLNNMRSLETNAESELDMSFTKQTKIEQKITLLTIKRTMICFFLIIFSVPFFISTTYKSYLSEYEQIANLANMYRMNNDTAGYLKLMNLVVQQHTGDYDPLVYLSGPGFLYQSSAYQNDEIRKLALREAAWYQITFQIDLKNTVRLYAICGL